MRTFRPPRNNARRNGEDKVWWGNSDEEATPPAASLTAKRNSMMAKEQWWRESRKYESAVNMNAVIAEIDTEDGTDDTDETDNQKGIICDMDEHCKWWSESLQFDKLSRDVTEFLNLNFNFQAETPKVDTETIVQKRVSLDDVPIPLSSNDMFGDEHDDDASTYVTSTTAVRPDSPNYLCCYCCCCCGRITAKDVCAVLLHLCCVLMGALIVAFTSTDIKLLWQCFVNDGSDTNDDYYSYSSSMCQEDQLSLETILIPILMFVAGATMVVCSSGYIILGQCCGFSINCSRSRTQKQNHTNTKQRNKHQQGAC